MYLLLDRDGNIIKADKKLDGLKSLSRTHINSRITAKEDRTAVYWFNEESKVPEKSNKPSVYFDMDGTLAKWYRDGKGLKYPEELLDPINHYYRDLEPHDFTVELAKSLTEKGIDVCIISCADMGAVMDKRLWLDRFCPFIKKDNIFFCPIGADKTAYIKGNADISILIDDYNPNLYMWKKEGGYSFKLINSINSTNKDFPSINAGLAESDRSLYESMLNEASSILSRTVKHLEKTKGKNVERD